ncbi:hypothetical protein PZE06_24305 [Robertmurraya sp. DFI.2.37]|uniref:hypothetical protein n=1 Tax=Robertmurraya sp. DFI.2.37 TaxID=3031819 RepID=UPI0012455105|nr:hypothetical protein [Robertmurraya sp. DFI.2.37]MDF1511259.1 hypothetical protein [Robertmurraya sp. DFI.2.37]
MKNIIIGNGVTIQFGGKDYTNERIIKRAINNVNTKNFPSEIYPREVKDWLILLFSKIPNVINGEYDKCAYTEGMKTSLIHFKNRYKDVNKKTKVHEIGFEDYFLLHFLICYKESIINPERFNIKESLRAFFIDSIFYRGKIQKIHMQYPKKFVNFLEKFDNIFTTNYDCNIEEATGRSVNYLHGAFHHLADVYNPESFRNKLSDSPVKSTIIIDGYDHLYSEALTSYSGDDKKFNLDMGINANIAIDKFVKGLKDKPELRGEIDSWANSDNQILKNMQQSIQLKENDEELRFGENKSLYNISTLSGEVSVLGLSPYNDNHIFEAISNNFDINEINFYYYDANEIDNVKSIFGNKNIIFTDVQEFWKSCNEKNRNITV